MHFASDNTAPAHPEVIEAIARANEGYPHSYGADPIMDDVRAKVRDLFEAPDAAVYLVATGTAANALILATLVQPWQAVFCHRAAHIETDECGAPEFYTGGSKLVLIDGEHAKMTPEGLQRALSTTGQVGVHGVQRGMLSLTNATENGTIYRPSEVAELAAIAHADGLPVHMDGARFANAVVAAGCSPAEMTWKAGVDALSFGGTKNGLMGVEGAVFFDPKTAWEFELRRKRGGHLISKHRYLSAQMAAYLNDDLWREMASAANARAKRLSDGIAQIKGASLIHPTQANGVFASWPRAGHRRAHEAGAEYYFWPSDQSLDGPDDESLPARLMCSWSTTNADVDRFLDLIRG
ncbi:MAG: low specificity L-threonine aldolase [Paracoccaceae bacterium]